MRGLKGHLLRFFGAIAFGLITFWPSYGLLFWAIAFAHSHTLPVVALSAVWMAVFFLFLPVPLWLFSRVSMLSLACVFAAGFAAAFSARLIDPMQSSFWLTWGVAAVFALIGWLMIATPLWRLFHGVVAVTEAEPEQQA